MENELKNMNTYVEGRYVLRSTSHFAAAPVCSEFQPASTRGESVTLGGSIERIWVDCHPTVVPVVTCVGTNVVGMRCATTVKLFTAFGFVGGTWWN